jgi:asparagine synthase (glutamine-hydrolysing)
MRMAFLDRGATSRQLYLAMRGFFPPQHVRRLLDIDQSALDCALERHFDGLMSPAVGDTAATGFNRLEFKRYLHDQLLRDTDVFSMAHSIEVRVPLLDRAIVDYAASIRPEFKIGNGINKPLLVGALSDPLLISVGGAKKQGFSLPMKRWMNEAADDLQSRATSDNALNQKAVKSIWNDFRVGRLHWSRAWALSVLGATAH